MTPRQRTIWGVIIVGCLLLAVALVLVAFLVPGSLGVALPFAAIAGVFGVLMLLALARDKKSGPTAEDQRLP